MSCEGHRDKYFEELEAETQHPSLTAQRLNRIYQAGRNRAAEAGQEALMEAKTRKLFADMKRRGIKPPTHSQSGLPKKRSQVGYAAVLDYLDKLKQRGHFAGLGKNGPGGNAKAASEGLTPAQTKEVQAKTAPALNFAGLGEDDTRQQAEHFPVWKHLPRCSKCGRWMATQTPVCQNPRCGLAHKRQRNFPVRWPPEGANFKHSRVIPVTDMMAMDKLPKAEIEISTPRGTRMVTLEYIEDGKAHYSEMLSGGVPIKGRGETDLGNVTAWPKGEISETPAEIPTEAPTEAPLKGETALESTAASPMLIRRYNAENDFIADIREQFGKTQAEAEHILGVFKKEKVVKYDGHRYTVKQGAFWEAQVMENALAREAPAGGYPKAVPQDFIADKTEEYQQAAAQAKERQDEGFRALNARQQEAERKEQLKAAIQKEVLFDGFHAAMMADKIDRGQSHAGALVLMGLIKAEADRRLASGDTDIREVLSDAWGENALNQISPTFTEESSAHLGLLEHLREQHTEQAEKFATADEENNVYGRCGHCGGFLDKDGQCNNPKCPGPGTDTPTEDIRTDSDPHGEPDERMAPATDESAAAESVADNQTETLSEDEAEPASDDLEVVAFDWQDTKPGDRLPDGSLLVKRRMRRKRDAEQLAEQVKGTVMIDGTRTWAVVTYEADEHGFIAGAGSSHDYIPAWMDIPGLGETDNDPNALASIKLFTPDSNFTYHVTEYDGKDTCFGLVEGLDTELGYFSLAELESVRGPLGLRIERELWTPPRPIRETPEYQAKWGSGGPYPASEAAEPAPDVEKGSLGASGAAEPVESGESAGEGGHCEHCGGFLDKDGQCNNPKCPGGVTADPPDESLETERAAGESAQDDGAEPAPNTARIAETPFAETTRGTNTFSFYIDPDGDHKNVRIVQRTDFAGTDLEADFPEGSTLEWEVKVSADLDDTAAVNLAGRKVLEEWNDIEAPVAEIAFDPNRAALEQIVWEKLEPHGYADTNDAGERRMSYLDPETGATVLSPMRGVPLDVLQQVGGVDAAQYAGAGGHCEHCGGFLDKDGQCNNPNCPGESTDVADEPPSPVDEARAPGLDPLDEKIETINPQGPAGERVEVWSDGDEFWAEYIPVDGSPSRVSPPMQDREAALNWVAETTAKDTPAPPQFMRLGTVDLPPGTPRIHIRRNFVQRGARHEEPYVIDDPDQRQEPFEYIAFDAEGTVLDRAETAAGLRDALSEHLEVDPVDLGLSGDNFSDAEQEEMAAAFTRCEHCGGFLDKDGQCNNPNCPGPGEDTQPPDVGTSTGAEAAEPDEFDDLDEDETLTQPRGHDYAISEADELGKGGPKSKVQANVAAIRLIKQLEEGDRQASPEEQAILVKYVGWGGLANIFDWRHQYADEDGYYSSGYGVRKEREKLPLYQEWKELKELLSEEEFNAASRSTINAHYTSDTVVRGVWDAIKAMGYDRPDGKILEPATGIGHFFGLAPEEFQNAPKVGVELDSTTAAIAKHLYQNADIRAGGFEDTPLPDDYFDLAISNVPFGDYGVFDPAFEGDPQRKRMSKSIHNYFFAKSLDKVKPGGVVAFITSRYTMDSADPAVREYLAEHADLVGAMRLPNTAFKENAGTEVTTDVIFLRKRFPGDPPTDTAWTDTTEVDGKDGTHVSVNQYFADHPEMMLGELSLQGGMYGGREVTLESDGRDLGEALQTAIAQLPKDALATPQGRCNACGAFLDKEGNCNNPQCPSLRPADTKRVLADPGQVEGQYLIKDGEVYQVDGGQLLPHEKSGQLTKSGAEAMELRRIRAMLPVNVAARAVLKLNVEDGSQEELALAQLELNQAYDAFIAEFGPVSSPANQRALGGDPNLPFITALENGYDRESGTAQKGAIFEQRVIAIQKIVESADSPTDALRVVLNESGNLNWERMSALTGQPVRALQKALMADDVVFQTPAGTWVAHEEYLSGNVRKKLQEAAAAAALDPAYRRNVEALQATLPRDLAAEEIKAALGSPWIPSEDIAAFAGHLFGGADFEVAFVEALAEWTVKARKTRGYGREVFNRDSAENTEIWGTGRQDARKLLQMALNGQVPTVTDKTSDAEGQERRVLNEAETLAARERQSKIKEEFEKWILTSDPERTERLVKKYNQEYNSEVPRQFDGSHVTLPGLAANMPELRAHQKDAVWRISQGDNTLMAHVVGAGKTFAMIGGSMELRRMGMRKKPMHVIPNHMLQQYTADFYRMYPAANVLAIPAENLSPKKRAETMSRIATGDWDAVIVTHSALGQLPVSPETERKYAQETIGELRKALELSRMDEDSKLTVKRLEKKLAAEEAKLKTTLAKIRDKQDNTIHWEELGVDHLIVDEADLFKNLGFTTRRTNLAGVGGQGSKRSEDLFMKIRSMKERYGDDQGVVFATGTPIANSISEMYTMQRYLGYEDLKDKSLAHFDSWASQFGETVTSIEMKPSGGGYQTKERFARFNNVPELKRMFMRFADIQIDPEALNLPRPKLAADEEGVRRQRGVAVPASEELQDYIKHLVERAENLDPRDRRSDNMLKITSEGRMAALDMRLVDPEAADNPHSKLNQAVENVFGIYQRTTGVKVAEDKREHNMAQMVFCDLGTPAAAKKGKFSVYHDIRRKLIARGVQEDEIAFMQDYKSDDKKADLFQKVNEGKVRVLIGSTQTMGAGTNAQKRLAALHHLDAPWRPRDVEQREGRILRPGNLNAEVEVHRYLTEESFDVYNWQLLERKAKFISQVMSRDLHERSAEDVDQEALTYAEMKALATGNPAVIEKVAVDAELRKLSALESSYRQRTFKLRQKSEKLPQEIAETQAAITRARGSVAAIEQGQGRVQERENQAKADVEQARAWARQTAEAAKESGTPEDTEKAERAQRVAQTKAERFQSEKGFEMTLQGRSWDTRSKAGNSLAQLESDIIRDPKPGGQPEEVGEFMGFPLLVKHPSVPGGEAKFYLKLTDDSTPFGGEAQLIPPSKGTGRTFDPTGEANNITRIRRALNVPAKRLEKSEQQLDSLQAELDTVQASAGGGFEHRERFDFLKEREKELDAVMAALQEK